MLNFVSPEFRLKMSYCLFFSDPPSNCHQPKAEHRELPLTESQLYSAGLNFFFALLSPTSTGPPEETSPLISHFFLGLSLGRPPVAVVGGR